MPGLQLLRVLRVGNSEWLDKAFYRRLRVVVSFCSMSALVLVL